MPLRPPTRGSTRGRCKGSSGAAEIISAVTGQLLSTLPRILKILTTKNLHVWQTAVVQFFSIR